MDDAPLRRSSIAFGLSFIVVNLSSAMLVVVKESHAPVLDWMKALTGHHWITHAMLAVVAYITLGLVISSTREWRLTGRALSVAVLASTIASGLIVAGYFYFA